MNKKSKCRIRGRVRLVCHKKDGSLKWDTGFIENTISNNGLAVFSGLAGNTGSQTAFTFLAVGTSSTAESAAHIKLQAEIITNGLQRAAATISRVTTTQTNDTLQLAHTWTASGGDHTVEEIGVFNVITADTIIMAGRSLTSTKTILDSETLTGTYQLIFS